jgi:hypothetical protein
MSARKDVCSNTLAFVLLDIQTVSSIGIDDDALGTQALALAKTCVCDVCTLIRKLDALSREGRDDGYGHFTEYLGLFYRDKVYSTKNRSFRFRCLHRLQKWLEMYVALKLEDHLTDPRARQRIARYSQRRGP